MKVDHCAYTDIGTREKNEDTIALAENNGKYCFILCDGLGGHGKGELASGYVANAIKECFMATDDIETFCENVLDRTQEGLLEEQQKLGARFEMKTTAVVLVIDENRFRYMYIGDSRLYHFRKNKVCSRSLDHSVPQMLALAGDIKEKHIRQHPDRNRLLRVMGVECDKLKYEMSDWSTIMPGDAFLLCSDGFWEPILEKEMCKLLKKSIGADEWLAAMCERVKQNAAGTDMDNNSAIAVIIKE